MGRADGAADQSKRARLDQRLVVLGLAPSRTRARGLIEAGAVIVDGVVAQRAADLAPEGARIEIAGGDPCPWVSRGALKLIHALDHFGLSPSGAVALDCGASTGGFTEVLLSRGAARVYAVDVGRDQLAPRLRADPRVIDRAGVNLRDLDAETAPEPVDWITADLAFISLEKALPAALARAAPTATLVALIKPQFEVGRAAVGKGGIVKDAAARQAAVERLAAFIAAEGWGVLGVADSPIQGGDGNVEYLLAARR